MDLVSVLTSIPMLLSLGKRHKFDLVFCNLTYSAYKMAWEIL